MAAEYKTNVMRILDKLKIPYKSHCYVDFDVISGVDTARVLNQNPEKVFKTLVTVSKSGKYHVFMIPAAQELDLKKAAESVGEKAVEMLKAKDLLPLTGYIHGGCSPVGMKKAFPTVIDASAEQWDTLLCSAGKIGYQIELSLEDLKKAVPLKLFSLVQI